jgi:hypothetical protein
MLLAAATIQWTQCYVVGAPASAFGALAEGTLLDWLIPTHAW